MDLHEYFNVLHL